MSTSRLAASRASRAIFTPRRIEALDFIAEAERRELETVGAESIGLDDLRAGFDISLVHAEDRFGLGGVEFIEASLRADRFMQKGTHRAVGDEDGIFEAFVEVLNFQLRCTWNLFFRTSTKRLSVSVPSGRRRCSSNRIW